jgi:hypothetical protein
MGRTEEGPEYSTVTFSGHLSEQEAQGRGGRAENEEGGEER